MDHVNTYQDNTLDLPPTFSLYEGNEYDALVFGKTKEYDENSIYGNVYHQELYVSTNYRSIPVTVMRVFDVFVFLMIGKLWMLQYDVPRVSFKSIEQ